MNEFQYCPSLTTYRRLKTLPVKVGDLTIGNFSPIRIQTMTTTDTMDTQATVAETIRCIEAGAELIRITAPSKKEAENLLNIKNELKKQGYHTPIVADIHFTPNAAEIAARIVEKVRINPGNYVDKKKFELLHYTDQDYQEELERINHRFLPLVEICKTYGTAMRIGTNHGSLSDRIMSRYGDTPMGMVESAMEFLRIARQAAYHNIVLSMKASNPKIMVEAYRLLVHQMETEFGECYPLHLGVTEAGDGDEGRIKSAIGIGSLLEDGIGDTIRVSLTEDPEQELPVCKALVKRYHLFQQVENNPESILFSKEAILPPITNLPYSPFAYTRRESFAIEDIGGANVPVVIADFTKESQISYELLATIGYTYLPALDKWKLHDLAADFICVNEIPVPIDLPNNLKVISWAHQFLDTPRPANNFPLYAAEEYAFYKNIPANIHFVLLDCYNNNSKENLFSANQLKEIAADPKVVFCLSSTNVRPMPAMRRMMIELMQLNIKNPVVFISDASSSEMDENLIQYGIETGCLFLEGMGDGIALGVKQGEVYKNFNDLFSNVALPCNHQSINAFLNHTAFSILQATRMRISKTEYISCPSCGRTLFDLQQTTAQIRSKTYHLKGVKIAIMGCIVNGPGEMADADFGYVGSGVDKITLYRGKEVVKKNIESKIAVQELINLLKENQVWVEPD